MHPLFTSAVVLFVTMAGLWLVSVRRSDAGLVDSFWGPGFVVAVWTYIAMAPQPSARALLVAGLVSLWGLRLGSHIFSRNKNHSEDYRYRAMRKRWDPGFWWKSLFIVFGLQGTLMWAISIPLWTATGTPTASWGWIDAIGLTLFVIGFLFETIGDRQLKQFKSNPRNRGKTLQTGLWNYTRHPNYFGDALLWWGFFLIGGVASGAWWTVFSPILMTFFLMKVSGVPLVEERLHKTRPDFSAYAERTSPFFPWFPKTRTETNPSPKMVSL